MNKKIFLTILILVMVFFVFVGCQQNDNTDYTEEEVVKNLQNRLKEYIEESEEMSFKVYIKTAENISKQSFVSKYQLQEENVKDDNVTQDIMLLELSSETVCEMMDDTEVIDISIYYGEEDDVEEKISDGLTSVIDESNDTEIISIYIFRIGNITAQEFLSQNSIPQENVIYQGNYTNTIIVELSKTEILELLPNGEIISLDYYEEIVVQPD